jgi:hypothetical protein
MNINQPLYLHSLTFSQNILKVKKSLDFIFVFSSNYRLFISMKFVKTYFRQTA